MAEYDEKIASVVEEMEKISNVFGEYTSLYTLQYNFNAGEYKCNTEKSCKCNQINYQ